MTERRGPNPADARLAPFLVNRRRRADISLTADEASARTRRRSGPGLRSLEVAIRAGVDPGYYAKLEQGRATNPSPEVLSAIARSLELTDVETAYLFHLAGRVRSERPTTAPADLPGSVRGILDSLAASPAYAMDRHWDLIAWNDAMAAVFGDPGRHPPERRNVILLMFLDVDQRTSIEDWEGNAVRMLRQFSRDAVDDPEGRFAAVIGELRAASADFRRWWPRYDVIERAAATGAVTPPGLDRSIHLRQQTWELADAPGCRLVTYAPVAPLDAQAVVECMRVRAAGVRES